MVKILTDNSTGETISMCEGDNVTVGIEGRDDLVMEEIPDIDFKTMREKMGTLRPDKKMFKAKNGKGIEIREGSKLHATVVGNLAS